MASREITIQTRLQLNDPVTDYINDYVTEYSKYKRIIWQEMIDFIDRQPQATWKDKALVKWKSYCFFIGPLVQDPVFENSFGRLIGWPWWFKVLYYRRKFKRFRHKFYRRKKHD